MMNLMKKLFQKLNLISDDDNDNVETLCTTKRNVLIKIITVIIITKSRKQVLQMPRGIFICNIGIFKRI